MTHQHPIRVVALRTGLTAHVIRIWEKRYGAVTPRRTLTKRRLYTDDDVARLALMRRATSAGRSIGQIANLSLVELQRLVKTDEAEIAAGRWPAPDVDGDSVSDHVNACLVAIQGLDPKVLDVALSRAAAAVSLPVFLDRFLAELLARVGECWRDGSLRVMHEHLVSSVLRTFLGGMSSGYPMSGFAPVLLATTPSGQLHELGALAAAATAASEGWRVLYLGPNLPAEEIAGAARVRAARVVLLSILHPADDGRLVEEMTRLRRGLDPGVGIVVGGGAASGYQDALESVGAVVLKDLSSLRRYLESLRLRPQS